MRKEEVIKQFEAALDDNDHVTIIHKGGQCTYWQVGPFRVEFGIWTMLIYFFDKKVSLIRYEDIVKVVVV